MKCTYCGHENPEGETFCSECGMKLEGAPPAGPPQGVPEQPAAPAPGGGSKGVRCKNCGVMNPEGASVCQSCNQPLRQPPAPPGPTPSAACPSCGFDKNPPTAKFCMSCGSQITPTPPPGPAPTPPPPTPPPAGPPPPGPAPTPPPHPVAKLVLANMKEIPLSGPDNKIGREDFLNAVSPDESKYVSREHIRITYENGRYYIADEGSTNGTKLNGAEIKGQGKRELNNNDEIILAGTITVRFQM